MRETPEAFAARTGTPPPSTDVRVAGAVLGTTPRPPNADEPCPTLFRDVGPRGLSGFLDGTLGALEGPQSACIFLRDATLPGYSRCVTEFGVLVFLQPLALGPWVSGQPGIWVAEKGRLPPQGTFGFVPAGEDLPGLDARLVDVADTGALREVLGGPQYDTKLGAAREALHQYEQELAAVEKSAVPLRAALEGRDPKSVDHARGLLAAAGLSEKDLRAPWFHLSKERRDEVRARLPDLLKQLGGAR